MEILFQKYINVWKDVTESDKLDENHTIRNHVGKDSKLELRKVEVGSQQSPWTYFIINIHNKQNTNSFTYKNNFLATKRDERKIFINYISSVE